ncbi:hypothetical protein ABE485_23025 [Achromobacter spanius]|uniref:hypothetical protein n=1 Tax=Achromobacter spanius TaxID=217203 RepID=UPI003207C4B7
MFLLVAHDQILLTGGAPGGGNRKSVLHKSAANHARLQANAGLYNGVMDARPMRPGGFSMSLPEDLIHFMQIAENWVQYRLLALRP